MQAPFIFTLVSLCRVYDINEELHVGFLKRTKYTLIIVPICSEYAWEIKLWLRYFLTVASLARGYCWYDLEIGLGTSNDNDNEFFKIHNTPWSYGIKLTMKSYHGIIRAFMTQGGSNIINLSLHHVVIFTLIL